MKYFECTVAYTKLNEEKGKEEKINDVYLASGETFGDAEEQVMTRAAEDLNVAPEVTSERVVKYTGILEAGSECETWYNVKAQWTDITERNGKTKVVKCTENYLVPASSTNEALVKILNHLEGSMLDYEILSITKTKITHVNI